LAFALGLFPDCDAKVGKIFDSARGGKHFLRCGLVEKTLTDSLSNE
jgi:hypothetical protein